MQDDPTPAELLQAVATFLRDELMPELTGRSAFLMRVGANAVDVVRRHLEHASAYDAAELKRLSALLSKTGSLEELNRDLCTHIESRDMTLATPGLVEHLWATTLEKVAIDQPQYAPYRRAIAFIQSTVSLPEDV